MTHALVAKAARLRKEEHPERYCRVPKCLYRLKDGQSPYCSKHTTVRYAEVPRG